MIFRTVYRQLRPEKLGADSPIFETVPREHSPTVATRFADVGVVRSIVLRVRVQREQTDRTRTRARRLENVFRTGDQVTRQVPGNAGRAQIRRRFPINYIISVHTSCRP